MPLTSLDPKLDPKRDGYAEHDDKVKEPFLFSVENVQHIVDRGVCLADYMHSGMVIEGDEVQLLGEGSKELVRIIGIVKYNRPVRSASVGDNVQLVLRRKLC